MSERAARGQIAAAVTLLVVLAALSEGWVNRVIARTRELTRDLTDTAGGRGESGFAPGAGAGQGSGGGGGGSF